MSQLEEKDIYKFQEYIGVQKIPGENLNENFAKIVGAVNSKADLSGADFVSLTVNSHTVLNSGNYSYLVSSDPASGDFEGQEIINTTTNELKKWYAGSWHVLYTFTVTHSYLLLSGSDHLLLTGSDKLILI